MTSSHLNKIQRNSTMDRSDGVDISPHCQRCGSTNTKFCYYNNYSLTQPRYFCKGCRRYWTKGGSLRNVPVGGGCRKSRRGRVITISRYHKSLSSSSCAGFELSNSSSSNIDLAVVYANFLKKDTKDETEGRVENLKKDDDSRTLEMGGVVDAMCFELPTLPNVEGLMFSDIGEWCSDSQLAGSNLGSLTEITPDKFTGEFHEISHLVDNWSSFDFSI